MLVSAMHITAAVWVNDDEPGLQEDTLEWLDKVAPPSWKEPANDVARELLPDPGDYRHHRGGEDNGDAHLKNLLVHHQVVLPITEGRLDLGPVAGGLLLRVRRPALEAPGDQGDGRLARRPQRAPAASRRSPLRLMVIGAVVSVQCGSAVATTLFDQVGPAGAVLYRLLFAAILLLAIWRPRPMEAGRDGLLLAIAFGVTLAGMNLCFYEALDRIPLGIAVTFEFVGPLLVGLLGSRRPARPGLGGMRGGRGAAADPARRDRRARPASASRCSPAPSGRAYILLSARVGRVFPGGRGLALAMGIAALLMIVPGTAAAGGDLLDPGAAAVGAATGVLSSVIPYSLELEALRRIAVGTFGVLMSMEPAVAALIGLIALGQGLATVDVIGIALVVVASAGVLGSSVVEAPTEA